MLLMLGFPMPAPPGPRDPGPGIPEGPVGPAMCAWCGGADGIVAFRVLICASAHPTVLHSVSYWSRFPRYCSLGQQARGYTQFSCLNSGVSSSVLTDSTSHRIVYSIFTRYREYSKAIHCKPYWSCRTTSGVVAGMGPGAAFGFTPDLEPVGVDRGAPFCCCGACEVWPRGPGAAARCSCGGMLCAAILVCLGLPVMPACACCVACCAIWCWGGPECDIIMLGCDVMVWCVCCGCWACWP